MKRWLPFLLLMACDPAGGGGVNADGADCGDICPEGTRKASFDAVIRGTGQTIIGEECETVCETIVPCTPPNIPVISADSYNCSPLESFVSFEDDVDVDFSWADEWVSP